jgi:hypothetical protein
MVREGTDAKQILERAQEAMAARFEITHSTFQIESASEAGGHCAFGSCDANPPTSS